MLRSFAIRNRVISSFSQGVVVTKARLKNGIQIMVDFALQHNQEVFALTAQVDSETSAGCNILN